MNNYDDATRGRFQCEEYAKQLISFDGLKFIGRNGVKNVTPTDIDGLVQLNKENCFIFFELKHSGDMPAGQRKALEELCDTIEAGGKNGVVFVANHNTPRTQTIIAKDAIVQKVYWRGKWYTIKKPRKLYEMTLNYIQYVKEQGDEND